MGSQSQSSLLEGKNLRVISQGESKTKSEGYHLAMTYKALGAQEQTIRKLSGRLHGLQKPRDWTDVKNHILYRYPRIHS